MRQRRAFGSLLLLSSVRGWTFGATLQHGRRSSSTRPPHMRIGQGEPTPQRVLLPPTGVPALSFEQVATIPKPATQELSHVAFSPDDRYITYLGPTDGASLTRRLYAYDRTTRETSEVIAPAAGEGEEASLSKEEQLRRERARVMSTGLTSYSWAAGAERLLVPKDGALYVQDGVGEGAVATLRRLVSGARPKRRTAVCLRLRREHAAPRAESVCRALGCRARALRSSTPRI